MYSKTYEHSQNHIKSVHNELDPEWLTQTLSLGI